MKLTGAGPRYSGSSAIQGFYCTEPSSPSPTALNLTVTVRSAAASDTTWMMSAFTAAGEVVICSSSSATDNCMGDTANLTASPS